MSHVFKNHSIGKELMRTPLLLKELTKPSVVQLFIMISKKVLSSMGTLQNFWVLDKAAHYILYKNWLLPI